MIFKSFLFFIFIFHASKALSNAFSFSLNSSLMNSYENFTKDGNNFTSLGEKGAFFRLIQEEAFLKLNTATGFELKAGANWVHGESNNGIKRRLRSQFTQSYLGISYLERIDQFSLKAGFLFYYPFERLSDQIGIDETNLILNNYDLGGVVSLDLATYLGGIHFLLSSAYNYRDEGRSHLGFFKFHLKKKFKKISLGAGAEGFRPISADADKSVGMSESSKLDLLEKVNAGSLHFLSHSPEKARWLAFVNLNLKNTFIQLGYKQDFYGKNTSKDHILYLNFTLFINSSNSSYKGEDSFEVEKEQYNRILFD